MTTFKDSASWRRRMIEGAWPIEKNARPAAVAESDTTDRVWLKLHRRGAFGRH